MTLRSINPIIAIAAALLAAYAPCFAPVSHACQADMQGGQQTDKRKLTTVQTVAADVAGAKGAVEVRYLDLPFGAATFGYLEKGGDDYYSNRTWPFAHLRLATAATIEGTRLAPGDYVMYITPKGAASEMTLTLASFKPSAPGGTFLVPGNVFVETPKDATVVVTKPVRFASGASPATDRLVIGVEPAPGGAAIKVQYGDRVLTESVQIK
jgi:hypothetical protein